MTWLVTGASGFLGRYVVAEALRTGRRVRAVVRPGTDLDNLRWNKAENVEFCHQDLREAKGGSTLLRGVKVVIHLAAASYGDHESRRADTLVATEKLLEAMVADDVTRLVHVSSFAVYDFLSQPEFSLLDETSALEERPEVRHAYAATKLSQEQLVRKMTQTHSFQSTVIRPGAVFGPGALWTSRLGRRMRRFWIRIGSEAPLPLTYVENVADAIVICAGRPEAIGQTFNVVDDDPPTQAEYMELLRRRTTPRPWVISLPWPLLRLAANLACRINQTLFRGAFRLPTLLVPASLHAEAKPLRYSNAHLKTQLAWSPRYSLNRALDRSFKSDETSDSGVA